MTDPAHARLLLDQVLIRDLALTPDGAWAVYGRRTTEQGRDRDRLWRIPLASGAPEPLTTGDGGDRRPRVDPAGGRVAFVSTRDGSAQAWLLDLADGVIEQVTDLPGGVSACEWLPGGHELVVVAGSGEDRLAVGDPDDPTALRITTLDWRADGAGLRSQRRTPWLVSLDGAPPRRVGDGRHDLVAALPAPGGRLAVLGELEPAPGRTAYPRAWTVDRDGGDARLLAELPWVRGVAFSPSGIAALAGPPQASLHLSGQRDLHVVRDGELRRLDAGPEASVGGTVCPDLVSIEPELSSPALAWEDDEAVLALLTVRGGQAPWRLALDGTLTRLADATAVCTSLAAAAGTVAVVAALGGRPPEVCAVEDGALRPLTEHGGRWLGARRREPEHTTVRHPDGHELDVWTLRPRDATAPGPTVLHVHGGPLVAHGGTPYLEMLALAAAGIAVVYTNPRGSSGHGRAHMEAIHGRWGGPDIDDLLLVVDDAVARGVADPARLGVVGLSYGGFVVSWLLGHHPGRFAAGVAENPLADLVGELGSSDISLALRELTGVPAGPDDLATWLERSPVAAIHRNHAPLLLLQAEADHRCPPGQSELLFAILHQLGRPVELIRYPGESHTLLEDGRPDRRVDRVERIVDWFSRHL